MALGRIQNMNRRTTAAEREAFEAKVFTTRTGSVEAGALRWGDHVEVLERGEDRSRIRRDALEGWVANGALVELHWVRKRGQRVTAPLFKDATGPKKLFDLLWGDLVMVLTPGAERHRVRARDWTGYMDPDDLTDSSLLEIYFIDVGQGDGVLLRTPDGRHLLIDGGYLRAKQPTGKSGADFVDWKFFKDYGLARVSLDAVIASHPDADHYGGLWDLLRADAASRAELDCAATEVGTFFHPGVSWWRPGDRTLGEVRNGFLVDLLDDHASVVEGLRPDAPRRLQGEWADFLGTVKDTTTQVTRIGVNAGDTSDVFLPGFGAGPATIRVLAPVFHDVNGVAGVKELAAAPAQNTNGHSVLLRVDFGKARILLTGDLNKRSMQAFLTEYQGREDLLACDVAKGCHHGSDDVSLTFLQSVNAAATVISSGDRAGHGHPRPAVVAASGVTGHVTIDTASDELVTPLVYSTEIERAVAIGRCNWIATMKYPHDNGELDVRVYAREAGDLPDEFHDDVIAKRDAVSEIHFEETKPGALRPKAGNRRLPGSYVVAGIIYGLVNVRTDGETIMCATMNDADRGWDVQTFAARF